MTRRAGGATRRAPIGPAVCAWQIATASASAASCGDGRRLEPQQQLHHLLHLRLLGAAVADDRELDLGRRVFDDRQPGLNGREHGDAARVPQHERASHVAGMKQILDDDAVRPAGLEQPDQAVVDELAGDREAPARPAA